jgi:hypothetical protein
MMGDFGFRFSDFGLKAAICALFALKFAQTVTGAEIVLTTTRNDIVVRALIDRERVELSGELTLALFVKGPGRVEVEPPRPLLSKTSSLAWRVREKGLPTVEILDKGQSVWTQEFQLSPFEGDPDKPIKVTIELAPLRVKAGKQPESVINIEKTAEIEVVSTIGKDRKLEDITGIESLPPAPPLFTPRPKPAMLVGLAIAVVGIVAAFVLIIVRRKKPEPPALTGAPRALRDLTTLRQSAASSPAVFSRIADIVREYLEDRFDIPAVLLTTTEVIARLQMDVPAFAAFIPPLQELLEHCDVAKFAGASGGPTDVADCIDRAGKLVEQTGSMLQNSPRDPSA